MRNTATKRPMDEAREGGPYPDAPRRALRVTQCGPDVIVMKRHNDGAARIYHRTKSAAKKAFFTNIAMAISNESTMNVVFAGGAVCEIPLDAEHRELFIHLKNGASIVIPEEKVNACIRAGWQRNWIQGSIDAIDYATTRATKNRSSRAPRKVRR